MTQCKLCTRAAAAAAVNREVADGADVVFTDTVYVCGVRLKVEIHEIHRL